MPLLASPVNGFWKRGYKNLGEELCIAALNQARMAFFYEHWGVPDTLAGRFDVACLHLALVLRHSKGPLAQAIFDSFFAYTEMTLREVGVSDLRVGKQVTKCAKFFYGAMKAYNDAFENNADLKEAISRNIYGKEPCTSLYDFEDYVRACDNQLSTLNLEKSSVITWPNLKKEGI